MDRVLLDTDIFSEILKGIDQKVTKKAIAYYNFYGHYTISVITIIEIVKGLRKFQREEYIRKFIDGLSVVELLTLDLQCSELAGRIYADLEQAGQTIGRADPMIAAIALNNDLTLVTGNLSHYRRIQALGYDLKLDNWRG